MLAPSDKDMFKVLYQEIAVNLVDRQEKVILGHAKSLADPQVEDSEEQF